MTQQFEDRDRFTLTRKAERYLEYKKSYPQANKEKIKNILITFSVGYICGLIVVYVIGI